jgi:PAS domain S-box-containing protein
MKLLETDRKEVALGSLDKTFTPTSVDMLKRELIAIWEGKTMVEDTGSILPAARQREVIIRWQALPGSSEPYSRVIVSFLDITELKRNEEALRAKELQSKQLYEQSGMGILLVDDTHTIADANPYARECLGYSTEELKDFRLEDLIHPEDIKDSSPMENLSLLQAGESLEFESRYRTRSGDYIDVLVIIRKLIGFSEEVSHIIMFKDISLRKAAEREVAKLLKEKELLLREVHHRIKNDMTTIGSILSLQVARIANEEAKKAVKEAEHRVALMQRIYDLLYTSENLRDIELSTYLSSIVSTIMEYSLGERTIRIETDFEDMKIPMKLAFPIGIIVNELITNARKYAFRVDSRGTIRTAVRKTVGDFIEIQVRDDGEGLPEPAVEGDESSGFGMTLIHAYAAQYGGDVFMESKKGKGTDVTVTLKKG